MEITSIKTGMISIIVPVFQVEKYLEKCVRSIINQTYQNLEIILVDDGSTDSCGKMCDNFAMEDSRIRVIHKANGGLSDARNAGMEIAKGQYIGFVDSDDYIEPMMYEQMMKVIMSENVDIVSCFAVEEEEDKPVKMEYRGGNIRVFSSLGAIEDLFEKNLYFRHAVWNKLYNRALFDGIRFPVGKLFEDAAIMYRVFEKADAIAYIDLMLYHYVQRKGSISNNIYIPDMVVHRLENGINAYYHYADNPELQRMVYVWNARWIYYLWETASFFQSMGNQYSLPGSS